MKILVLCAAFPPNPGVGGRRWVKFAKYLTKLGHEVVAITRNNKGNTTSEFQQDAKQIPVIFYDSKAPTYSDGNCKNVIEKIKYRLWLLINSWFYKGNIYDSSIRDEKNLQKTLKTSLVGVDVLIVTGAPFHLSHHSIKYAKKHFPHVTCVFDIRDPWTSGSQFGMSLLDESLLKQEKKIELETLKIADVVLTPHAHIVEEYQKLLPSKKYILVENGYDMDDFVHANKGKSKGKEIIISYGGSLYYSKEEMVNFFVASAKITPGIKIKVNIYNPSVQEVIQIDNLIIAFKTYLDVRSYNAKLAESDILLQFRPQPYQNWWSSKTAEIFIHQKPILIFGPDGDIAALVKTGYGISLKNMKDQKINLAQLSSFNIKNEIPEIVKEMNIKSISEKLNGLLIQHNQK